MKVKIYVEGGGDSRSLHIKCREGFRKLLEKAGFKNRMPATKACGSRGAAFEDFRTALESARAESYPILLVDSEGPVAHENWAHLQACDGWAKPAGAEEDQAQLMVQCMETWCLADREALVRFFGQQLQSGGLPPVTDLEARAKDDVQSAMENATRACGRDKMYGKGKRSFELLAELDPMVLKARLPHFAALCETLNRKLPVSSH